VNVLEHHRVLYAPPDELGYKPGDAGMLALENQIRGILKTFGRIGTLRRAGRTHQAILEFSQQGSVQ
jgi:hypothetical protein